MQHVIGRAVIGCAMVCAVACGGASPVQPSAPPVPPSAGTPPPAPTDPGPPTPSDPAPPPPPVPRLSRTRIVAFGDSFTEGVTSTFTTRLLLDLPGSYPSRLRTELASRYKDQTIEVFNEGKAGEWAEQGRGRFPDVIRQDAPEIVILMEGANDLAFLGRRGISATIGQLESMVKYARARGIPIMLASLPPQREGSVKGTSASFLPEFNKQVRDTAVDEGAIFVDVYAGFGTTDGLIGPDGLHPTTEGYVRLTQIFFDAIRANFEAAPPATATATATAAAAAPAATAQSRVSRSRT